MTFVELCALKGVKLLREDITFIRKFIKGMNKNAYKSLLLRYTEIWLQEANKEENEVRKQNSGRKMANSWLTEQANERNL